MAKGTPRRAKHIPQRTCVGCRQVLPKRSLIRIVRSEEGVRVDLTGKARGRGAYLHNLRSCWEKALKGALAQALRTDISEADRQSLLAFMATLPTESDATEIPSGSRDSGAPPSGG